MKRLVALIVCALMSTAAYAQTPTPSALTGYALQIQQSMGGTTPYVEVTEIPIPINAMLCDQPKPVVPAGVVTNPTGAWVNDPTPGKVNRACTTSQVSLFQGLPPGDNYRAVMFATSNVTGPPNDRSGPLVLLPNFRKTPVVGPPVTPTGGGLLP